MVNSSDSIKRGLSSALSDLNKSNDALSSGKKKLDPAALAVVAALDNEAAVYKQASKNIDYGQSVGNIQDSVYEQTSAVLTRMSELATQSANGTLSDSQRGAISQETQQLQEELTRQVASAEFNGQNVFNNSISIQAGTDGSANSQIQISAGDISATLSAAISASVGTQGQAASAIDALSSVASAISSDRASVGANQARLSYAQNSVDSAVVVSSAASSRIKDADIAEVFAQKVGADIRTQVSTALFAQNNQSARIVQTLLT